MRRSKMRALGGFTLVELLVVIGIIGLLLAMLLPVLGGVRRSASELRSQSGLRQMMIGYTMYHQENRGAVLMGYTPPTVNGGAVTVEDPVSGRTFGAPAADRYPWRLLGYVGDIWEIIHSHTELPAIPSASDSAADAFTKAYRLSINPTYGINAVYVGGQAGPIYQGFAGPSGDAPNVGRHVVFRANEVRRSTELIVFADGKAYNAPGGDKGSGLHYLTPPRARGQNWEVVGGKVKRLNGGMLMGVPEGWYSKRVMVAFFDGHVESRLPGELEDMRLWANWAEGADYDFAP
jgi:prepilin-type N-terminal cleavage/methylation domain-containing protein/prepilin-type processing-associated H-X9-DG protein